MRASGSDDKVSLAPPIVFSLEDALEYIKGDEYVEITPNNMLCVRSSWMRQSASAKVDKFFY